MSKEATREEIVEEDETLRRENAELRRRLEEVSRESEALRQRVASLQANEVLLQAFLDHTPAVMYAKDAEGRVILANSQMEGFFNVEKGALLGKTDFDYFPPEEAEIVRAFDARVMAAGHMIQTEDVFSHPEGPRTYITIKFPIPGVGGGRPMLGGVSIEITAMKRAEAARNEAQEQLIAGQQAIIRELATPLLPIAEHALLLPIVGAIDAERAQRIIEQLLQAITDQGADTAIIDITGVRSVDAQVAEALVHAAHGVRLLGAKVVLTGIQPSIARTLVEMGVDLGDLATTGTLQEGIARALQRRVTKARKTAV